MIIDTRPQRVDLKTYGGDTLSLRVNVTGADYSTATWTGEVRADHDSPVDAEFIITPDALGANIVLSDVSTDALVNIDNAPPAEYGAEFTSDVLKYQGVWDIQIDNGGPTKTLIQGIIQVYADVTKEF